MSDDVPSLTADTLLAGPRGRDLCFALLPDPPPTPFGPVAADVAEAMRQAVGRWDPASLTRSTLHAALLASVDDAMYWQAPWKHEAVLAADGMAEALRPVAEAVAAHPDTAWWTRPSPVRQWSLHPWEHPAAGGRPEGVPAGPIEQFLAEAEDDERRFRAWRETGEGPVSGIWWTQPPARFTRARIPEAFDLIEDSDAPEEVAAHPVRGHGRVVEIRGPEDWVALCREHPFEVTESRRGDWGATTGRQGRWFLPDWRSVARDWDGVHLTVAGYLSTATRALALDDCSADTPDGDGRACLMAGFDPDATLWLTDVVRPLPADEEPTQLWGGEPTHWHRVGEASARAAVHGRWSGRWAGVAVVLAGGMLALTGCAAGERVLWGEDGYAVKRAARSVIDAAAAGEDPAVCDAVAVDLGDPDDWRGAGAGEPERIDGRWHINVEVHEGVPRVGEPMPGDLVFGATADGLCLQAHLPSIPIAVSPG